MKLSDKFNGIYSLIDVDNRDAIVNEIKALKNFSDDELSDIFGSSNILWVIENYTIRELKDKVKKAENSITIDVGDIIKWNTHDDLSIVGVILEVTGISKNRCTALCFHRDGGFYKVIEGISSADIEVIASEKTDSLEGIINMLRGDRAHTEEYMEGE